MDDSTTLKLKALTPFCVNRSDALELLGKFDGDVLLAAGYADARSLAVKIKSPDATIATDEQARERWNLSRAANMRDTHFYKDGFIVANGATVEEHCRKSENQRLADMQSEMNPRRCAGRHKP